MAEENVEKSFYFWPQLIQSDPLVKEGLISGLINECNFTDFLNKFSKLLCWRKQSTKDPDETLVSQVLCYADQLLLIFNSANVCVQLQAAKLLLEDKFRVLQQVLRLSLENLDTREINSKLVNSWLCLDSCSYMYVTLIIFFVHNYNYMQGRVLGYIIYHYW